MAKTDQTSRVHVTLTESHTFRVDTTSKRTLPAGWRGYVSEKVAKDIEKEKHGKRMPKAEIPADAAPAQEPTGAGEGGTAQDAADARLQLFSAAVATLGKDDFTDEGAPSVDAINAALPQGAEPVTADERDALWAKTQAAKDPA